MSILYRVYSNGGVGGPVDYSSPIAETVNPTHVVGPLSVPGEYRFGVRAFDTSTGIEEANTQATVELRLDAAGRSVGGRPNRVHALVARAIANGGCRVEWAYNPRGQSASPADFQVELTAESGGTLSTLVPYRAGSAIHSCAFSGLVGDVPYTIIVKARSESGVESLDPATASIRADTTPPDDVEDLVVSDMS